MPLFYGIQRWNAGVTFPTVEATRPASIKVMDGDATAIEKLIGLGLKSIVIRHYAGFDEDQSPYISSPRGAAALLAAVIAQYRDVIEICERNGVKVYAQGLNEVSKRFMWGDAHQYNDHTTKWAEVCARANIRPIAYSWATGNLPGYGWAGAENPEHRNPAYATFVDSLAAQWAHFADGLRDCIKAGGTLGLNAYGGDSMVAEPWRTWFVLRYRLDRLALAQLGIPNVPVTLLEFGIDGQLVGKHVSEAGWRGVKDLTAQGYADQLAQIDLELFADSVTAYEFEAGAEDTWKSFNLDAVEEVQRINADSSQRFTAAGAPQEGPMPKPTKIEPIFTPAGHPGGEAVLTMAATGVDGFAKGFVDVEYPVLPGNEFGATYGPNMTTEVGPFIDGAQTFRVKIAENSSSIGAGVIGKYSFRLFETDGKEWDGGIFGPFDMEITPAQAQTAPQPQPAPAPVSPTVPSTLPAEYDPLYKLAGDLAAYGDVDKQLAVYFQQVIKWRKGEPDGVNPFSTPRR